MSNKLQKLIQKAEMLRTQDRLNEALDVYKIICTLDRRNPNVWMITGSVAGNIGKLEIAETAFKKACTLIHGFGKQNELLIQTLEAQGKYSEAINILVKISNLNYAPDDIVLRIGVLYGKSKQYEKSITWLNKHIETDHNNAFAHHCLASAYESENMLDDAEKHFKAALSLNNKDHKILNNYAALLQKTGRTDLAIETYNKSINLNSQYPISQYNLAELLLSEGKFEEALPFFTKAVELKPDYIEAIIGLGRCHQSRGANLSAIETYQKLISINPSISDIYIYLSQAQLSLGYFDAGLESLKSGTIIDPDNIHIQCALVELYEKRGLYSEAEEIIRPLLVSDPNHNVVVAAYASLCKKLDECDHAIELISNIVNDEAVSFSEKSTLHFKAGKILDGMAQYDAAFDHYSLANQYQNFYHDPATEERSYINTTTLFSKNSIETLPRSSIKNDAPIFIVGMPRSGTTLVEQIITSLPEVYGAGELPYLNTLSNHVAGDFTSGKENITTFKNLDQNFLNELTSQYIQSTLYQASGELFFTDKMPHNFELIGIINILFPDSKIIHCQRNPIDNCLSIYFSEFNSRHPYACNLNNLANYYSGYYEKLMNYWYDINQVPLYNVSYEDIVNDQENTSRKLIDFCGFDWDENCLDFHKAKRDVATISYDQVRQPIYKHSIERWRNYEKHIAPLIEHFKEYT